MFIWLFGVEHGCQEGLVHDRRLDTLQSGTSEPETLIHDLTVVANRLLGTGSCTHSQAETKGRPSFVYPRS